MADLILSERRGSVQMLTLNRPEALNALSRGLLEALGEALAAAASSAELRALVLTGAGRAFAAGADIAEMREMSPLEAADFSRLGHATFAALEALPVPTIAAVNGFALGGGCELALACDWIYAARGARFGQPEVRLGLVPGFGGSVRLARRVGPAWARELVLTGEPIGVELAERIGLVNRSFEDGAALREGALACAEAVARCGPLAVAEAKRLLVEGADADARVAHRLEQSAFGLVFASQDRREGVEAFLARRDPGFQGR